ATLTLREVLEYSSNVGISRLAERLPPDFLYSYMKKLHFADGRPMPAVTVAEPKLRPLSKWGAIEYANATFGQGFLITPLHLTAAY
ncbi:penicillin-binding transpeptidase domain-containing protein, partial [Escherichia coli]|nr:penicillin-binding transpeptidase domain-containing protein [Escherichia coli]